MAQRSRGLIGVTNPPPKPSADPEDAAPRTDYEVPAGATAALYAQKRFGAQTRIRESRPTAGVTPAAMLGQNPKRLFWMLVNTSVNAVSYGEAFDLTVSNGLPLAPSGGGVSMAVDEDGEAVTYPVMAVASIAASTMYAIEVESI